VRTNLCDCAEDTSTATADDFGRLSWQGTVGCAVSEQIRGVIDPGRTLGRKHQWDRAADEYAKKFSDEAGLAYAEAEAAIIKRALAQAPGRRVLELCCGAGRNTCRVVAAGYDVTAIDLAPRMLQHARGRVRESGLTARFAQANATRLPFPAATFDAVYGTRFFYILSWEEKRALLREVWRVLRPAGMFALQFNCLPWGYYREIEAVVLEGRPYRIRGRYFSPRWVASLFEGWEVLRVEGILVPKYVLLRRVLGRRIADALADLVHRRGFRLAAAYGVITARKPSNAGRAAAWGRY